MELVSGPQADFVLSTLNARYIHASFGLRYLLANLGDELRARTKLLEFTLQQQPREIAERILALRPRVVGFGVYIWNAEPTRQVVSILKRLAPELVVILGGPEVSYETEGQPIVALADHVFCGESEETLPRFLRDYFERGVRPSALRIQGPLPDLKTLRLPYEEYSDDDLRNRVLYVEASRGCPYKCEYCLSSLDKSVRTFDLDRFLSEMKKLLDRGARQFKFVDRTFNLSLSTSQKILEFFLEHVELGLFLHFELVPDRLPEGLKTLIQRFPPGSLQFEIGIQTWNPEVARLVSRRQDYGQVADNLRWLKAHSGVHTHVDLIAGLPGESLESFGRGLDAVAALEPDEIQLGVLKRLKGTPIIRHDSEWGMVYDESPPFQVLQTRTLPFSELQELGRVIRFWDLIGNSGNLPRTFQFLRQAPGETSLFGLFRGLARFLGPRHSPQSGVALLSLVESLWRWSEDQPHWSNEHRELWRVALLEDYAYGSKRRDPPRFLISTSADPVRGEAPEKDKPHRGGLPKRQQRHQGGISDRTRGPCP
jgi:radical SAM superfamily enzyme YgiQ (UPF0313 family)